MSNDSNTNNKGYVYILSNSATPGLLKLGMYLSLYGLKIKKPELDD